MTLATGVLQEPQWSVELAPGEPAEPGEYRIREVAGNRLILARP